MESSLDPGQAMVVEISLLIVVVEIHQLKLPLLRRLVVEISQSLSVLLRKFSLLLPLWSCQCRSTRLNLIIL